MINFFCRDNNFSYHQPWFYDSFFYLQQIKWMGNNII